LNEPNDMLFQYSSSGIV